MPHHFTYQEKMQQGSGSRKFSSAAEQHFNLCCFIFHLRDRRWRPPRLQRWRTCSQTVGNADMQTGQFKTSASLAASKRPDALAVWSSQRCCVASRCSLPKDQPPADTLGLVQTRRSHVLIPSLARLSTFSRARSSSQRRLRRRWHKYVGAPPMKPGEHNPITRHLETGCVTNGVWLVIEFLPACSWQERLKRYERNTLGGKLS